MKKYILEIFKMREIRGILENYNKRSLFRKGFSENKRRGNYD